MIWYQPLTDSLIIGMYLGISNFTNLASHPVAHRLVQP